LSLLEIRSPLEDLESYSNDGQVELYQKIIGWPPMPIIYGLPRE